MIKFPLILLLLLFPLQRPLEVRIESVKYHNRLGYDLFDVKFTLRVWPHFTNAWVCVEFDDHKHPDALYALSCESLNGAREAAQRRTIKLSGRLAGTYQVRAWLVGKDGTQTGWVDQQFHLLGEGFNEY